MTKRLSLRDRIMTLLSDSPETEFRPMQIAAAMCCPETEVSVRLSKDLKAGRICKRRDGRAVWYRIGDVNATAPEQPKVAKPEPEATTVPTVASAERFIPSESTATGWQPPKMVPPRGEQTVSGRVVQELQVVIPPTAELEEPQPADDGDDEQQLPDAFLSVRTGELQFVGIEPEDDGRIVVPPDLVACIKRYLAWGPTA